MEMDRKGGMTFPLYPRGLHRMVKQQHLCQGNGGRHLTGDHSASTRAISQISQPGNDNSSHGTNQHHNNIALKRHTAIWWPLPLTHTHKEACIPGKDFVTEGIYTVYHCDPDNIRETTESWNSSANMWARKELLGSLEAPTWQNGWRMRSAMH